jgi:hypothetical protein
MSLGSCAAVLKTASRANPAVHLPYRPRLRATPHRPSRNVRRYDWSASSGSVVDGDPVNRSDPSGLQEALLFGNFEVSKAATYSSDDPNAGVNAAAKMNGTIAVGVASTWSISGLVRWAADNIFGKSPSQAAQNTTKAGTAEATALERNARNYDKLADRHFRSADELRNNPTVKPEMQGNTTPAQQQAQRQGRIETLERDGRMFRERAERLRQEAERLRRGN